MRSRCVVAAVVGDTVDDPFNDTSAPSLNILIKLMSMVAVVFARATMENAPIIARRGLLLVAMRQTLEERALDNKIRAA